jgi:iron complex transport system ATP-binding protein
VTLAARGVRLGYGGREAVRGVDLVLEPGELVALIGPNGSGKSTLLRGLARLLRPRGGVVELDGRALAAWSPSEFARRVALLSQAHEPAESLTVRELVALGRHPHQGFLSLPSASDHAAIETALAQTDLMDFAERCVSELSGGEAQRAWFALALAQQPRILLLDEPTTFLDLTHQLAVLELVHRLNAESGLTVVMALHDLGQAARYCGRLVLLRAGRVLADGPPAAVLTVEMVRAAYGVEVEILTSSTGAPVVVPLAATPRTAGRGALAQP